ncbi:MAG: hypothetical protein A4E43_00626 [Methanosaeta sp. PtaB.Bin005]|nr:MAG: hypothetical protein A4E43_00626 [Methanosaeta sp. PtaB.Bin005]
MGVLHVIHVWISLEKDNTVKQNLTISLDRELIMKARVISARRRTSVSRMLGDELKRIIERDEQYQSAKQKALANLRKGFHMGGRITTSRDDLHER